MNQPGVIIHRGLIANHAGGLFALFTVVAIPKLPGADAGGFEGAVPHREPVGGERVAEGVDDVPRRVSGHRAETSFGSHVFNTVLTYKGEPQSYSGKPPGLSTRLFLRLGAAPHDTLCHLIYPASTPWHALQKPSAIAFPRKIRSGVPTASRIGAGALRACSLNRPTIAIRLVRVTVVDNRAAMPVPPHFRRPLLARHAR